MSKKPEVELVAPPEELMKLVGELGDMFRDATMAMLAYTHMKATVTGLDHYRREITTICFGLRQALALATQLRNQEEARFDVSIPDPPKESKKKE